jgi:hypothetical protein
MNFPHSPAVLVLVCQIFVVECSTYMQKRAQDFAPSWHDCLFFSLWNDLLIVAQWCLRFTSILTLHIMPRWGNHGTMHKIIFLVDFRLKLHFIFKLLIYIQVASLLRFLPAMFTKLLLNYDLTTKFILKYL